MVKMVFGISLVLIGATMLLDMFGFVTPAALMVLWPLAFIAVGVSMIKGTCGMESRCGGKCGMGSNGGTCGADCKGCKKCKVGDHVCEGPDCTECKK